MTAPKAYKAFKKARPDLEVTACYEYDSCFVFHAVPPKFATPEKSVSIFNSLFSVDKDTESISAFKPLDLPPDERKRRKRIVIYDR